MAAAASASRVSEHRAVSLCVACKPVASEIILASGDFISIGISAVFGIGLARFIFGPAVPVGMQIVLLVSCLLLFCCVGLYPAALSNPVQELKRVTAAVAISVLFASALSAHGPQLLPSLCGIGCSALTVLLLVPLTRNLLRGVFCQKEWFGHPAVVLGSGTQLHDVVRRLQRDPQQGLKLVAVFASDRYSGDTICGIPVIGTPEESAAIARTAGIKRAVVAMQPARNPYEGELMSTAIATFSHVLFVPGVGSLSSAHARLTEISRATAIQVSNRPARGVERSVKRCADVAITSVVSLLVMPVMVTIALLIKLESSGPLLYGHTRIGRDGRLFKVWKFRSMVTDGDRILQNYLAACSEAAAEWASTQKLCQDPRITRIGSFLRKTSLDELPQLWNILLGEMSLVGPRPVIQAEASRYGEAMDLYTKVPPGLTGLWQVSGRNNTTYDERVQLDSYYVSNWSFWLDIYVLAKTVRVVLLREGAY